MFPNTGSEAISALTRCRSRAWVDGPGMGMRGKDGATVVGTLQHWAKDGGKESGLSERAQARLMKSAISASDDDSGLSSDNSVNKIREDVDTRLNVFERILTREAQV